MVDEPKQRLMAGVADGAGVAVVAMVCYATVNLVPSLRETYWAPMAAVVVLYPEREATRKAVAARLAGTIVGCAVGAVSGAWWHGNILAYGMSLIVAVVLCHLLRLDSAARLCAVAVTVLTIGSHPEGAAAAALHRCVEVSYGIMCAWVYTAAVDRIHRLKLARSTRDVAGSRG